MMGLIWNEQERNLNDEMEIWFYKAKKGMLMVTELAASRSAKRTVERWGKRAWGQGFMRVKRVNLTNAIPEDFYRKIAD